MKDPKDIVVIPMINEFEEGLMHYGVLGMHWGVRKDRTSGLVTGPGGTFGNPTPPPFDRELTAREKQLQHINYRYTTNIFSRDYRGTNMNCGNTVVAEEMSLRGEKTYARLNKEGMFPEHVATYFNLKASDVKRVNIGKLGDPEGLTYSDLTVERGKKVKAKVQEQITKSFPPGARGALLVPGVFGNHFMSFERTKTGTRIDNPQDLHADLDYFWGAVISKGPAFPCANRYGIQAIRLDKATTTPTINQVVTTDPKKVRKKAGFDSNVVEGKAVVQKLFTDKPFPEYWNIKFKPPKEG